MIEYPKIETLYDRDPVTHKVIPGRLRLPEFALPRQWIVTEKIDGMNIRVHRAADGQVTFAGRTAAAQLPAHLLAHLKETFTQERMDAAFAPGLEAVVFGEGYGAKIQSGHTYRPDAGFILFDVWIDGWWLEPENLADIAAHLNVMVAPSLDFQGVLHIDGLSRLPETAYDLAYLLDVTGIQPDGEHDIHGRSIVASWFGNDRRAEGIVARTRPLLFTRDCKRLMWKLKFKDF